MIKLFKRTQCYEFVFTYRFDNMPSQLINIECPEVLIFMAACQTATKHVHGVAVDHRSMMTDRLRLNFTLGLQKNPATRLVLIFCISIEIVEGQQVYHPEIIKKAFTNIMSSKYVEFILVCKCRMVPPPLRKLRIQPHFMPIHIGHAELILLEGFLSMLNLGNVKRR